jgi:NAD(P)-dependent dehydrogenase (short-subunit alcohol dehydrogenase family)
MDIAGKVVVVTGAGNGLGRQLVLYLIGKGAQVAAVDLRSDGLNETRLQVGNGSSRLSLHQADVSNRDDIARVRDDVLRQHGHVDIIINNAGIIHAFRHVLDLDTDVLERMINVNLYGAVYVTKAFLPMLLTRPGAHIVNVSSIGGVCAFPGQAFYGASKAAIKLFTEGLHSELQGTSVRVTSVVPGALNTDITRNCDAHSEKLDQASKYFKGTDPGKAARQIMQAVERRRFMRVIGIDAKALSLLNWISHRFTISLLRKVMDRVL